MYQPYKFKWNKIRHVQSFLNYIMIDVILKSPKLQEPTLSENIVIPKYWTLIQGVNEDYLLNPLSELYVICKQLDRGRIKLLKRAVLVNNRIKGLCEGQLSPVRYSDLDSAFAGNKTLEKVPGLIKAVCNNLYTECLGRKAFTDRYGNLKSHYDDIVVRDSRCRLCGFNNKLETKDSDYRDDFDHYLPKGIYPFVSVNFFNLVPTCSTCNQKYKKTKDTILYRGVRKKAFYPYSNDIYEIQISVSLNSPDIMSLSPEDINISLKCEGHDEEVRNWDRVYGIKKRYKAYYCDNSCVGILDMIISRRIDKNNMISLMENALDFENYFLKLPMVKAAIEKLGI